VNDSIKELLDGIKIGDLIEPVDPEQVAAVGGGLVSIAV